MTTSDLYYICQVVDRVMQDTSPYLRNLEDFMGDMASGILVQSYPKWTPLHDFVEFVVRSIAHEELEVDPSALVSGKSSKKIWVDHLLSANGFPNSYSRYARDMGELPDVHVYFMELEELDVLPELLERVAAQVFWVLFSNRRVLRDFGRVTSGYVLETAPAFFPEKFTKKGVLLRKAPTQWAKDSVFHRDKGKCVFCSTDLTRLVNQASELNFDHIVPLAHGGMNDVTNLQLLCAKCNAEKSDRNDYTSIAYDSWYDIP